MAASVRLKQGRVGRVQVGGVVRCLGEEIDGFVLLMTILGVPS